MAPLTNMAVLDVVARDLCDEGLPQLDAGGGRQQRHCNNHTVGEISETRTGQWQQINPSSLYFRLPVLTLKVDIISDLRPSNISGPEWILIY